MQYSVEILVLLELNTVKFIEREFSRHSNSCRHKEYTEGLMRSLDCLLSLLSRVATGPGLCLNTAYPTELTDKSIPNNSFWILVLNLVQQPLPTLSLMHLPKHSPAFLLILQAPNRSPKPLIVSRSPDCCPTLASLQAVLTGTSISMALLGTSPYSCPVGKARQNRTTNLNPSPNPGLGSGGKTPSSPV